MKNQSISFEFCDFDNPLHTNKLTELLNYYMLDPMGDAEPLNASQQELLIKSLKQHPSLFILFILVENQIVGFSTLFELFSTFKVKPYLYIHDFVIHSDLRGNGLGKALMHEIIEVAKSRNCCKITLEVREDNISAKKLYQNLAFKPCEPDMHFWTKWID